MSKNFELMQQTGKDQEFRPIRKIEPAAPVHYGNGGGNGHREADGLDLDQLAGEEALRLVQRVFLLQTQEPPHMVVFAGIDHGSGCSRICMRAAETLAKNIRGSVCLVEANLRSPALPEMFGTTNHHGLTDALLQDGPIRSFAKLVRGENLWLLSSGALAADSANLLNSERIKTRFAELRKEFDFVLIDTPPLTRYADATALGQMTDGVILVLEANATRREAALQVAENLRASNIRVLGAVLNKRTFPIPETLYNRL
ncbi:MAG: CpsD/CapB family tyrosine-protein kinase [Candidatus Acidiferrales bacterium]